MKCEKCGKDLEGNLKVCSNCVGKITVKKSNKKFIVGISILLLLVVIVVILYFYKNSKYDYESYEKNLEAATKNYILVNKINLSDKESNIVLGDLYAKKLIDDELEDKCEGYVIASKEIDEEGYEQEVYDAYIKCGIFYRTQGYNDTYAKKTYIEEKDETQEEIEGTRINSNLKDCPNYITNLTKEQLISQYKFEKTIMATDIEGEYETTYSILLSLYDNNVMNVITKAGEQASGENYYGIYKIDGDKLTITRKNPISVNGDQCYDGSKNLENKTDVFTISDDKSTLTTPVYLGESSSYTSSKYITGEIILTKVTDNTNKTSSCPEYINKLNENDIIAHYKYSKDYKLGYSEELNEEGETTFDIELKLYPNNIMHIAAGGWTIQMDDYFGKYEIKGDNLIITRLNYGYLKSDNTYFCAEQSFKEANDIFKIDKNNNTLTISDYNCDYCDIFNIEYPIVLTKIK